MMNQRMRKTNSKDKIKRNHSSKVLKIGVALFITLTTLVLLMVQLSGILSREVGIDECEIGTAAYDIAHNQLQFPLKYYQVAFGSHEGLAHRAYVTAFFFKAIGVNALALRGMNMIFVILIGILFYFLLKKTEYHPALLLSYIIIVLVLLVFPNYFYFFIKNDDTTIDISILSLASLLLLILIIRENSKKKQNWLIFSMALLLGLGVYASLTAIPLIMASLVILAIYLWKKQDIIKKGLFTFLGLIIGLIPWLLFNLGIGKNIAFTVRSYPYIDFGRLTLNYFLTNLRNAFFRIEYLGPFKYLFLIGLLVGGYLIIKMISTALRAKKGVQNISCVELIIMFTSATCFFHYVLINASFHGNLKSLAYYVPVFFFTILLTVAAGIWIISKATALIGIAINKLHLQNNLIIKKLCEIRRKTSEHYHKHKSQVINITWLLLIVLILILTFNTKNPYYNELVKKQESEQYSLYSNSPLLMTCREDLAFQLGENLNPRNISRTLTFCSKMNYPLDEFCAFGMSELNYELLIFKRNHTISVLDLYKDELSFGLMNLSENKKEHIKQGLLKGQLIGSYWLMGYHPSIHLSPCQEFTLEEEKDYCEMGLGARLSELDLKKKIYQAPAICSSSNLSYDDCVAGFCLNRIFQLGMGQFRYMYKKNPEAFLANEQISILDEKSMAYCLNGINLLKAEYEALYSQSTR